MSDIAIPAPLQEAVAVPRRPSITVMVTIAISLLVIIRGPFWVLDWPDDAFYSEVALLWRQGLLPYVHAFDVKPPGLFALLSAAQTVFGPTRVALRVIGGLSDVLTMTLLMRFVWQRGAPEAGILAASLFAWFMNVLVADDCYSLLIALTTLAVMLAMSGLALPQRAIAAGLAIGAAGVVKQTAAFEGLAILLLLMRDAPTGAARLRSGALLAGGALVPPMMFAGYFALNGALVPLLTDVIGIALQRPGASSDHVTFMEGIGRFLLYSLFVSPLFVVAIAVAVLASRIPRFRADIYTLRYWFLASIASVIVQRALLASYLAPLLPPVCLLMALGLVARFENRPATARRGLFIVAAALTIASLIRVAVTTPEDMSAVNRTAAAISAAGPRADDRLFVIGSRIRSTWLYVKTGLRPPLPFIIPSQQACPFPNVGPVRIDEAFAARPRFVVTEEVYNVYGCETENVDLKIRSHLEAGGYRVIAHVAETKEQYVLYERMPAGLP